MLFDQYCTYLPYKNGDTEYFDIVAGVLKGDKLAPYLFIICLDYVLRTSIDKIRENGFELTRKRSRRYPEKTITDADYADDIAILSNTPNQAETLLHSLERAVAGIGLHVNAHKTEYMCYNHTGDISTLDGTSQKLVNKFTYLGSSFSSTERDIDTQLTMAWTAMIGYRSYGNQTWPIKWNAVSSRQRAKAGRTARTYIQQLCEDTVCSPEELPEAMNDKEKWWERVRDIRASGTTWWWWWLDKMSDIIKEI